MDLSDRDQYEQSHVALTADHGSTSIDDEVSLTEQTAFARQLVRIGNAGLRAEAVALARQQVVESSVGVCGSNHVILVLREVGAAGTLRQQDVVSSTGIARQLAVSIADQARSSGHTDNLTRALQFSTAFDDGTGSSQNLFIKFDRGRHQTGGLVLVRNDGIPFTDDDVAQSLLAADQVNLAIERAALEEQVRQRATERQLVSRLTQTIVGMQSLPEVLSEVAAAVRTITGWDACAVAAYARDLETLSIEAVEAGLFQNSGLLLVGERLRLADWHSLRFALDNCSPYQLSLEHSEALGQYEREYMTRLRANALLAVPIALNAEAVGLVMLFSRSAYILDASDLRAVREIGANAALAIQHNQFATLARRQADEQAAMLRISRAIISTKDMHAVLAEICRASLGFEGIDGCRILLWHKDQDRFEIGAVQTVRDWQMYYQVSDQYPSADWPTSRMAIRDNATRGYLVSDPDVTARERANHDADQIQSFHTFPINVGNEVVGVLSLLGRAKRRFSPDNVRIGQELAYQAAQAIDRARLIGQLQRRAETDGLTGLLNHRAALETLDRELAAARKLDEQLSIIVIDLDDFKFFNDTHGHITGDQILVEVATALYETSRSRDYVARYGGDEFLLILPSTSRESAAQVAERILQRMSTSTLQVGTLDLPIRVSVGVATFPQDARNRQELIAYGDAAMYAAKERGGGQLGMVDRQTRSLEVTPLGALSGLVQAVDRKDRYTKVHSDLVAEYSVRFGRSLGLAPPKLMRSIWPVACTISARSRSPIQCCGNRANFRTRKRSLFASTSYSAN